MPLPPYPYRFFRSADMVRQIIIALYWWIVAPGSFRASYLNTILRRCCTKANISEKGMHKIRKSFISTLIDNGDININFIREQVGIRMSAPLMGITALTASPPYRQHRQWNALFRTIYNCSQLFSKNRADLKTKKYGNPSKIKDSQCF